MHAFRAAHVRRGIHAALALSVPLVMTAQLDRSRPPAPGPAPETRLGEHVTFALPNGMQAIVVEDHRSPMLGVQVYFDVPPIVQGEKAGYVELAGELLAAGAGGRTKAEVDELVDRAGATLQTSERGLYLSGLKKNIVPLMGLVADVVQRPAFDAGEFEKARTRLRSAVQQRRDDPEALADAVGRATIFGLRHPYGEIITERSVEAITVQAVRNYHKHFFTPSRGYLVFVGDITQAEARQLAEQHFGQWTGGKVAVSHQDGEEVLEGIGMVRYLRKPRTAPERRSVAIVDRPDAPQSLVRVTYALNLPPKDIRALSAQVMNTILGGGVFNARLMQNLREDKGYTYGVYSHLDIDRHNASFTAAVSVRPDATDSAVTEILSEMERMRNEPVAQAELDLAKEYLAGSFVRSLEDPRTVARFALLTQLNGLPKDHYATYLQRLAAVTLEDVRSAAEAFLKPEQAVVLVVGDAEAVRRKLIPLSMDIQMPVVELNEEGEGREDELVLEDGITAEAVIEQYLEALGGRKAIAAIKNMTIVRMPAEGALPVQFDERFDQDGRYRLDVYVNRTHAHDITCDGRGCMQQFGDPHESLMGDELAAALYWNRPVPEAGPLPEGAFRTFEGVMERGTRLYKVMTIIGGDPVSEYFDAATGLKVRRIERKVYHGRPYMVTTHFGDYRPVNGVKVPHRYIVEGGPLQVAEMDRAHVTVNKGVSPDLFVLPGGGR
jgi:zinc protease